MDKAKKSKLIYAGVIVLLCVIFICLFGFGLKKVLAMEGAFPPVVNAEGKTPVPLTKQEVVSFLNRVVDDAVAGKPQMSVNDYFSIDDDSITVSGSDALKHNLLYFKGNFIDKLEEGIEEYNGKFGEAIASKLNIPGITPDDIEAFDCDYIYYACTSCGHGEKEQLQKCEECGNPYPYVLKYRDEYEITVTVNNSRGADGNFKERTDSEIKALYGNEFDSFLTVDSLKLNHDRLELIFKVNRVTDRITMLEYRKTVSVNARVSFTGELKPAGAADIGFVITEGEHYGFTWPGIELSDSTLSVEPKSTNNLAAKLICDDPASPDYVVTWASDNEDLLTVDSEGYIKAGKGTGTAVITASYVFQGVTYTDSCEVTVKVSAESSEISKRRLELKAGDSAQLEVKVLPKEATIKTVKWYSEDESVAAVDENGIVTAISSGKTTVYSLTDDGFFKSSCEVTVG